MPIENVSDTLELLDGVVNSECEENYASAEEAVGETFDSYTYSADEQRCGNQYIEFDCIDSADSYGSKKNSANRETKYIG